MEIRNNQLKKKGYLIELFRHGYFVVSLLLAVLSTTLMVCSFDLHLFPAMKTVKNLDIFVFVSICTIALFILIYMIAKVRCSRLCIADSLGFTFVLLGVGVILYVVFGLKISELDTKTLIRLVMGAVIFAIGLTYVFLRMAFFKVHERRSIIYIKNSLAGYYSVIGQKYSFASVLITGLVISSLLYLALNSSFANFVAISLRSNVAFAIIMGFVALCFVLYCVFHASEKSVNPLDLVLCSGIVFFPIGAVNSILLKEDYVRSLTILCIILAVYLMLVIVRLMCFDVTVIKKPKNKRTFSEVLLSITISALIVGAGALFIPSNAVLGSLSVLGKANNTHAITFFPVITITLTAGIAMLFNLAIGFVNINADKRTACDTLSDASFITSIFGFALIPFVPTIYPILAIIAWFFINLMLFIARTRRLKENA